MEKHETTLGVLGGIAFGAAASFLFLKYRSPSGPDPDGLAEYSVVYTDRALNHMSKRFQGVMNDLSDTLKEFYNADYCAIVPGGGTYAMESVARQLNDHGECVILRNGFFSYRWTQIFEKCNLFQDLDFVMKASGDENGRFRPMPIESVVEKINADRPAVVFAPHVETASGIILSDDYIKAVADAVHQSESGLFVLDCIASGCVWVDMKKLCVDVLISAPQKGWSGPACAGFVMLSERALHIIDRYESNSFAMDLRAWLAVMEAYENGGHKYHATMPTDALIAARDVMLELKNDVGKEVAKESQIRLGREVREMLASKGLKSVAAAACAAPGVVVMYSVEDNIVKKFIENGVQIAGGVRLECDEPEDYSSFRIGLFGIDKITDISSTVKKLEEVVDKVLTN